MTRPAFRPPRSLRALFALGEAAPPSAGVAHVKWFAPYTLGAPPQPVVATLQNA